MFMTGREIRICEEVVAAYLKAYRGVYKER
jgi:hypothetical protein